MNAIDDNCVSPRRFIAIIAAIKCHRKIDLFEVAEAFGLDSGGFAARERRQKHGRKDSDDGDDNEQFDEGESGRRR